MRLLMIGRLNGELITASKICMQRGASVTQADAVPQGLNVLRARGADLIMIDVGLPIRELVTALEAERIRTPVVACGVSADASAAVAAIRAGAALGLVNRNEAILARTPAYFSCAKAARELGYRPGPIEPALARAVASAF